METVLPRLAWPPAPATPRFHARAFPAQADDLAVAFAGPRPMLVTALLSACLRANGQPVPPAQSWRWTAAERLQGLLAIAAASLGPRLSALAACDAVDCGERIEMELGIAGFASTAPESLGWRSPQGELVRVALPTGEHQQAWHEAGAADVHWLARQLVLEVGSVVPGDAWELPDAWLAPLDKALADADPLTVLSLDVICPCCGRELEVDVDIEQLVLENLRRRQLGWLDEVHRIAHGYHWHEEQIVALPEWRRRYYLQRLQGDPA